MAEKKKANKSTGPRTEAGKAASSLNAVSHGIRSSRLLLPHENPDEYQALLADFCLDLQPVGTLEQLLVKDIVDVVWRKMRLDGAEQAILTAVQMPPATDEELKTVLKSCGENLPRWMYAKEDFGIVKMKPLPNWMRDPNTLPSAEEGAQAEGLYREWSAMDDGENVYESEEDARRLAPLHWSLLQAHAELNAGGDPALALKLRYNEVDELVDRFCRYMDDKCQEYYWVAYCHRNRHKIDAAFRAIRAKRMLNEWEPEKSHRYTTMFDRQLIKLLHEFRAMRAWRLANLDMVDDAEASSANDAEIVTEIRAISATTEKAPRKRKPA